MKKPNPIESLPGTEVATSQGFFETLRLDKKLLKWFLIILAFCFFTKVIHLGYPSDFYFDEVYHGFTATVYLHGDKQAYDPWAKPPEGKAFEWTHPPLSKLIMAGMMWSFGENPFGWRIGSVLFGTMATVATGILAFELFGSIAVGLIAIALMSMENLVLAQSRIAMNDSYLIFFMLLGLIGYVRWRRDESSIKTLYWTGLWLGLAAATKWTTVYIFLIIAIDLVAKTLWTKRLPKAVALWNIPVALGLLPVLVYLGSYLHYFSMGYSWAEFVELCKQMWWYHTNLQATHSYQSKTWQWLLNLRPVWFYVDYAKPGYAANIYNLGNTVLLYSGLFATISTLIDYKKWDRAWETWFILMVYFMLWFPWTFSPRIMLFYHYLPAVPALYIILARWLAAKGLSDISRERLIAKAILAGGLLWFVVYYPNSTATPVPEGFANIVYFSVPTWHY